MIVDYPLNHSVRTGSDDSPIGQHPICCPCSALICTNLLEFLDTCLTWQLTNKSVINTGIENPKRVCLGSNQFEIVATIGHNVLFLRSFIGIMCVHTRLSSELYLHALRHSLKDY